MSNSKMTNQEFITRLKVARFNLYQENKLSSFQLFNACQNAGIFYGIDDLHRNANFADAKFASADYLKRCPANERHATALAVINASIKALKESGK